MRVLGLLLAVLLAGCSGETGGGEVAGAAGFTKTPQQHAMPTTLLVAKRTPIEKARVPVIDFHGNIMMGFDKKRLTALVEQYRGKPGMQDPPDDDSI